ncbi:MAG: DUF3820 family protein [Sulfurimonas sp.]|uniref:putative quorum-sensing-regulated virulence factor n=1 Tax=Sulfurimonas sp. TaxID=2022749 RepID=UPI0026063E9A|nr:DUF3820 family protein [Sulfurimonas sp.]MCW8894534.1 DUF3820 family protein [Sulfurimonas sp.]MCW8955180.1 DUF3820 family protein [Sulfurimonas sp.]MCW9067354.1 DUF3820 family protein [Sulfurimonas sp.]
MKKAHFIFTKLANSFSVHVQNLEELSVEQIQEIQTFVSARKGVFDFETYTFAIQKKIEFRDFISLMKLTIANSTCEENILKTQQKEKVEFGKYKGMFYSELPDSYLLWLKSNYRGKNRDIIDAEISFRTL